MARSFSCDGATELLCDDPAAVYSTGPSNEATTYGCSANTYNGNERAFSISLAEQKHVTIEMNPSLPGQNLDLFLLGSCNVLNCISGEADSITVLMNPGTYFLIVDGLEQADNGNFQLELRCADISSGSVGCGENVAGDTILGNAWLDGYSCTGGNDYGGNELVYTFTNPLPQNVYVSIDAPNLDVILSPFPDVLTCSAYADDRLALLSAAAGDYYIAVDGASDTGAEPFNMTVQCGSLLDCAGRVSGSVGCPGMYSGTTVGGTNNTFLYECTGYTEYPGPEVVYLFTNSVQQDYFIWLLENDDILDIFVFNSQCDEGRCVKSGDRAICLHNLPVGEYYVVIDGPEPSGADYELAIDCSAPPPWNHWTVCESPRDPTNAGTTVSDEWFFSDFYYCYSDPRHRNYPNQCDFAMYAVADCGDQFHIPLFDVESGYIKIHDMLNNQYVALHAESEGGWTAGPSETIEWEDCTGNDPRWNMKVTDIHFYGSPTVCGVYRLEFFHWGGHVWDLFANCTGTGTPGFKLYDTYCEALVNYNPHPELVVDNLDVTGTCPDFLISFDVTNIGCVAAENARVHVECNIGGSFDLDVPSLEPGVIYHIDQPLTVTGTGIGTVTAFTDYHDRVTECSEVPSSEISACVPENNRKEVEFSIECIICANPPVVELGSDLFTCEGEPIQLGVNLNVTEGTPPYVFNWQPAAGLDNPNSENPTVLNPTVSAVYTCNVLDSEDCIGSDFVAVNVIPDVPAQVVPGPLKARRAGNDVEFFWNLTQDPTYNLRRHTEKEVTLNNSQKIVSGLLVGHYIDEGAIFPFPEAYFYKVSASDCRGNEGPVDRNK